MANLDYVPSLRYSLVLNTLPETTGYHYAVSHVDSRDANAIYEYVAANLHGQTVAGARLVWEALVETVKEALAEHLCRVSVSGVTFDLAIPGSTTSVNGMPTEGAYVSITPSAAIRNAAADISLVYYTGEEDVPKLKREENLADHRSGEIIGTESFRLAGSYLTTAGDDETITVVAANGTEAVAEVIREDGYGMFVDARLSAALPAGKGKVVLKTHGKRTPEGELRTLVKSVTILTGEEPPPTPIAETEDGQVKIMTLTDGGESSPLRFGHEWAGTGSGFQNSEAGWYVELAILRPTPEGEPIDVGCLATSDTALTVTTSPESAPAAGDYPNATLDIGFAHDDAGELVAESLTIPIHLVVS